jgi:hypothetical protein
MKKAMHNVHNSGAFGRLAESMLRCDIGGVSWEEFGLRNQGNDNSLPSGAFRL